MGGIVGGLEAVVSEPKTKETEYQELLGIQAVVHPDGGDAWLTLHATNGDICLSASLDQVASAHMEIRAAAVLMQHRQSMARDKGEAAMANLLRTALRPTETACVIDPATGDYFYVMQFSSDRLPIAVRLTPEQVEALRAAALAEMKRTAN